MYADNTTGETTMGHPTGHAPRGDDSKDLALEQNSPQHSPDEAYADEKELLLSPESPPPGQQQEQNTMEDEPRVDARAPNWQAPAFLPPYAQKSQTVTSVSSP